MCGIACFISTELKPDLLDFTWIDDNAEALRRAADSDDLHLAETAVTNLSQRFEDLMSFDLHYRICIDKAFRRQLEGMLESLKTLSTRTEAILIRERTDRVERLNETLLDYQWQLEWETLGNTVHLENLMPQEDHSGTEGGRQQYFLAWSTECVLQSIDKLEVRGRDSAGIAIAFTLKPGSVPEDILDPESLPEFRRRSNIRNAAPGSVLCRQTRDGRYYIRFVYKVSNLVGQLGDNGRELRRAIHDDDLMWNLGRNLDRLSIIAHTRWASNGVINIPNCHPVNGDLISGPSDEDYQVTDDPGREALFILNGDVDNYADLVRETVLPQGLRIHPTISTDAKILPVLFLVDTPGRDSTEERFRRVIQRCEGSMAVCMQHPEHISSLFMAQKGSGQSLYVTRIKDGFFVASEAYGVAAYSRWSYPLVSNVADGAMVVLSDRETPSTSFIEEKGQYALKKEQIEIFSRDIFRKGFDYYIEKEVHEAPESVRKTLQAKYVRQKDGVVFQLSSLGNGQALVDRLHNPDLPAIRRISVIGQGTASIAARGIAYLIRQALNTRSIEVSSAKGSELISFSGDVESMEDTILIAVSQSGTTTDTNRVVDMCRKRGAWVHSIVNRRNSPLVLKSHSHIYTSNGRDVEMAVASTKAFYSQVTAGAIIALILASELKTLSPEQIEKNLAALESLPQKIEAVLDRQDVIGRCAHEYAPANRYWALVGNGPNHIAAEEIRIKLSELCYKSIPCDFTEDKKHIDLSTEPLTLVVANDLPEAVVMDTVKETTIFKAHNGRPIVFCSADETRFDAISEAVIKLPPVDGGFGFVLATVAGHLWGIEAAKAIDRQAEACRQTRALLTSYLDRTAAFDRQLLLQYLERAVQLMADGKNDSALPAHMVAKITTYMSWLMGQDVNLGAEDARLDELLDLLNKTIDEMTRPIDTIRHQAKTVTVGISRPEPAISPVFLQSIQSLGLMPGTLKEPYRNLLAVLSPLVDRVPGCILYQLSEPKLGRPEPELRAVKAIGSSKMEDSRYRSPQPVRGSKKRVWRTGHYAWSTGASRKDRVLIIPIFDKDAFCTHQVLFHLEFRKQASLKEKQELLRALDKKRNELVELFEEKFSDNRDFDQMLNRVSVENLIFQTGEAILADYSPSA